MPDPRQDGTVRVFVSSTFRDMHAERDHLITVVFAELRERIERLGLEFFDVDLRWGVPETGIDGEKTNSWEYCKRWIDEVEPFFICMLGQRYGWRPPASEILDEADRAAYAGFSVTEMEVRHALLNHPHDKHSLFYLRETEVPSDAANYAEYVDAEDLDDLAKLKTLIRESGRPVRRYQCTWTGSEFTDLDDFGEVVLEDLWGAVLRDERYVPRSAWEEVLGTEWEQDPLYADPSAAIPEEIWQKLVEAAKPPPRDPLDVEADQMARFAESRLRWFQGRTHELAELRTFVEGDLPDDASRLCVVRAAAGTGKTALLAKLAEGLDESGCLLLTHFVGASEQSASAWALVNRLLQELDRHGIPDPEPEERPELDLNGLSRQLARRLASYDRGPRLVILLDALNQLTDGHSPFWLPQQVGPNVRLVVSCLDDPPASPDSPPARVLQALQHRRPEPRWVDLSPLRECDIHRIVRRYLREYCKQLDRADLIAIRAMPQARNPLYLRVMLDVLRALGGNDIHLQVSELIARLPVERPDATSLFKWLLERLDIGFGENEVRAWCSYLALGRVGMSGEELAALLARKLGEGDSAQQEAARRTARRIERALRRYLQRRGPQWDFFHGALREAAERHCLSQLHPIELHADIAGYLETRWRDGDVHALSELPYHQTEGKQAEALLATLTDYRFLDAKLRRVSVQSLIEDYERAETAPGLGEEEAQSLRLIGGALRLSAHVLAGDPGQLPSQLWGRMQDLPQVEVQALLRQAGEAQDGPWLRPLTASLTAPGGSLLRTFFGHNSDVTAVAVTADGRRAISGGGELDKDELKVWDLVSGAELRTLAGHSGYVTAVAVTADGGRAVTVSRDDKTLKLWNLESGAELRTLAGHTMTATAVTVTADGSRAVSASWDWTLKLWDLESGEALRTLTGHTDTVTDVALTADGCRAVSASYDGTLKLWDLESGAELSTLTGHSQPVNAVAVTPDGCRAVSASDDETLKLWDLESGAELHVLAGHSDRVTAVAVTADGRCAVSGSWDNTLKLWDLENGAELRTLTGHSGWVNAVAVTADGRQAVSASYDQTLKLWDLESSAEPRALTGHSDRVTALAVTADGRRAVSGSWDNTLKLWDLESGAEFRTLTGHSGWVSAVAVMADGRRAVSASWDHTLKLWDLDRGAELRTFTGHTDIVTDVAVTADGCRAVSASNDKTVKLWDLDSGSELRTLTGHSDGLNAVAVTPDGRRAVSGSRDNTLKLWDLESGEALRTLTGHTETVTDVALTADGCRAVSASYDGTLKLWDLESGAELRALTGWTSWHHSVVDAVAVTPDGRRGISASADNTLKLWDLESGEELRTLAGHDGPVWSVAVTADGRRAVSASWDHTLKLWDLESGACLCSWRAEGSLPACAVGPDDVTVIAGDETGHVQFLCLQNVTPGPLIVTAWLAPRIDASIPWWRVWRRRNGLRPAFGCLHCRVWSEVPSSALGTELPCPHCGKAVKLNPFTIEADWRPIAAAWRGDKP